MATLMEASNQWSSRPDDQRFSSLQELHDYCQSARDTAKTASVPLSSVRVEANGNNMALVGKVGVPATFTNWSFGQLCLRVGAPAGYLRQLPPTLAAQNVNHGLAHKVGDDTAQLYLHNGDGLRLHAVTSEKYSRIWDSDITSRLIRLTENYPCWQPAPPAFDGSRGLYASDHDLFAFMVDNDRRIFDTDPNGGLSRGFFVWNSEVGAASFGVMTFLYEYCCGNHRVWGATGIQEIRVRHIGEANDRAFNELEVELRKYIDASPVEEEAKIEKARTFRLGADKDELLDFVFSKRIPSLTKGNIEDGYDKAVKSEALYGDPLTAWGFVGGLTEVARDLPHADGRVTLERAAGKVMEMAF